MSGNGFYSVMFMNEPYYLIGTYIRSILNRLLIIMHKQQQKTNIATPSFAYQIYIDY